MTDEQEHREEVKNSEGFVRSNRPDLAGMFRRVFGSKGQK